jgi:hypothetical protein
VKGPNTNAQINLGRRADRVWLRMVISPAKRGQNWPGYFSAILLRLAESTPQPENQKPKPYREKQEVYPGHVARYGEPGE